MQVLFYVTACHLKSLCSTLLRAGIFLGLELEIGFTYIEKNTEKYRAVERLLNIPCYTYSNLN